MDWLMIHDRLATSILLYSLLCFFLAGIALRARGTG